MTLQKLHSFISENVLSANKKIDISQKEELINLCKSNILGTRYKIIDYILPFIINKEPELSFLLIYDIEKYEDKTIYLLEDHLRMQSLNEKEFSTLYTLKKVKTKLLECIQNFSISEENLNLIITTIVNDTEKYYDLFLFFKENKNLNLRFLFMKKFIQIDPQNFSFFFKDIINEITYTDELNQKYYMSMENLSELACALSLDKEHKEIYETLKDFIIKKYYKNNIAQGLININNDKYLLDDLDTLFLTSKDYKIEIYEKYSSKLSQEIVRYLQRNYEMFQKTPIHLERIYAHDLDKTLTELVDKYLSISKSKNIEYIAKGTTSACYRIGDYVIKFILSKYNNSEICPSIYLINKAYFEELIRDDDGKCIAGLEVQKYLSKKLSRADFYLLKEYRNLLKNEGYYLGDSIRPNFRFLNSYKDADCIEPEFLPKSFKEKPLVCIDRDCIYKLPKKKNYY